VPDFFVRVEVARVALVVGVVVSILFYERVQLTTGGAIVPAYLTMALPAPLYVVSTLVIGYATYLIVNKVIARRVILYGRRKFEVEVLVGLALVAVATLAGALLGRLDPFLYGVGAVGMLIPGVLAHDMFRQTPRQTLIAVGATTAILAAFVYTFSSLAEISPLVTSPLPLVGERTGYPRELLLLGAAASVVTGLVVFSRLGIRSGGFISAAYLALVLVHPMDLLFAGAMALVTFLVVTKLVMPHLLVFGRRKLSAMLLVGSILVWTAETAVIELTNGAFQPWHGLVLMALMIPALLANDAQRQGLEKTLWGATLTTGAVYGCMNVITAGLIAAGFR
jgi:poly-gamma-glutamate biosynthesis protein PgsC/CapC